MPETDFEEKMILIRRTARMQAGGRRFRFGALVVVATVMWLGLRKR